MTENNRDLCVTMVNDELELTPTYNLSPDFSLHWYTPGDEEMWIAIHRIADKFNEITPQLFFDQFADNVLNLHERQCYLLDKTGKAIATGTSWAETDGRFSGYGKVHWMAVLPVYQSQGIGKMLMSTICRRLLDLGHIHAFLRTSTLRQPAIRLYEKFGFRTESIEEWELQDN